MPAHNIELTDEDIIKEFKDACLTCEMDKDDGGRELINLGNCLDSKYTMQLGWKIQDFQGKLLKNGEVIATYI